MREKKYCQYCATGLSEKVIEGRNRLYCPSCQQPIYENPLPATAAVLIDEQDRILLVKRKVEPKKGEWCLPGGFIELGETPEQACMRELTEETGIVAETHHLVGVYPSKSPVHNWVLVIGFVIDPVSVQGQLKAGDDAEDVAFFHVDNMPHLAFFSHRSIYRKAMTQGVKTKPTPPIDGSPPWEKTSVGAATILQQWGDLGAYVITGGSRSPGEHEKIAREACQAGARILQYRDKCASRKVLLETARKLRRITAEHQTLFIINDYIDIALIVGADGVHLGQDDISIADARKMTPPGFIIGCSTHSLEQAVEAEKMGADYIGSGPVFATPTKEDYPPIGIDTVKKVLQEVKIPVVTIGGLNLQNIAGLRAIGAKNFAMVREFENDTATVVKRINSA